MKRPLTRHGAFVVRHGEQDHRVEIALDGTASVGTEQTLRLERLGADTYRVTAGGISWQVVVHAAGNRRQVFVDGAVFEFEVGSGLRPRQRGAQAEALSAPMPARVREVLVKVGQEVVAGDVLVTLEAMKMELSVRAPRDGKVASIACQEGELVQHGVPLLQLEA